MSDADPARSVLSVVLVNDRREVSRLAEIIDQYGASQHWSEDTICDINLVLDEVVANVIVHGYTDGEEHRIHVTLTLEDRHLTILVEDDGVSFNLLDAPAPRFDLPIEERPIGGLGVYIVKSIVDSIKYTRDGNMNRVTMKKLLPAV